MSIPLLLPTTVVFDGAGTMYVAETNRHVVDRIDASGQLTVVAGTGTQGFSGDGGPATSAQLDSPQGLAVDAGGNVYIADTRNHRIRVVSGGTGTIATIAGTGTPGFSGDGGPGANARLNMPIALALDMAGSVLIADANNHRVRQLSLASGVIRTIAGNGTQGDSGDGGSALSASIDTPSGLAVDAAGNIYLADTHNHRIRRMMQGTGLMTTVPTSVARSAIASGLLLPRGVAFDQAGNLYVTDSGTHRIVQVAINGTSKPIAGSGVQGFAGDGGNATLALLDQPRTAAISPTGMIAVADSGNQRVRQFTVDGTIQTLDGSGGTGPSPLTISMPPVVPYGSGLATVILNASTVASGIILLFDQAGGLLNPLGTASLNGNAAGFSTETLAAGMHRLLATYAGDATHAAGQSAVLPVTISPVDVTVSISPAEIYYGQAIPVLTGSLAGVLPRDAGLVTAAFATNAEALSSVGMYPIVATLAGPGAGNYRLASVAGASLTIAQAPSATSLATTAPSAMQGSTVTLQARVASTTRGTPTGRMTFLDGGAAMASTTLDSTGGAMLAAALSVGTHMVTAVYSGDLNFRPSTSSAVSAIVTGASTTTPDFVLSGTGASSQTISAGSAATYTFLMTVQNGPLNSPILLSAGGMPPGASTTFSPTYLPPGGGSATFTLTVQTGMNSASLSTIQRPTWAIALWGTITLLPLALRRRRARSFAFMVLLSSLWGCGDRITALPAAAGSSAKTYPLVVTATSTMASGTVLQHAVPITLTVQ